MRRKAKNILPLTELHPTQLVDEGDEITVGELNNTNSQYFILEFEYLQTIGHYLRRIVQLW